jgi:hypothetical protein
MMGWRNVKMDIRYVPRRDEYERQLDETTEGQVESRVADFRRTQNSDLSWH